MTKKDQIKELKQQLIEQKSNELLSLVITESYLTYRIKKGEKERESNLTNVKKMMAETKSQIDYFKKQ